jgi:hypothetical protein
MSIENKQPTLPYVAYPTFKEFIRHLHVTVTTDQIDNTMMPNNFSGSARAAVTSALKSLGFIDAQNTTTQKLRDLVTAYDTKEWPAAVKKYVLSVYNDITKSIDLKSATRKQIDELFGNITPQMKEKNIRFFLSANKEAGVEYSQHLKIRRRLSQKRTGKVTQRTTTSNDAINQPLDETNNKGKTPSNMFDQPIPIGPDNSCYIRVPRNITVSQVALVKAAVAFIEAMAQQNKETKK